MLIQYLLTEAFVIGDIALDDKDIRTLERTLRKEYGLKNRDLNQASANKTQEQYLEWLVKEVERQSGKGVGEILGKSAPATEVELDRGMEAPEPEEKLKDEAIIDVLKYLIHHWRNKDRVRVIAARFGVDPDLYAMAGLGNLPENYSDEDIWNTMDMSKEGKTPFYQSAWQPFYIESLGMLQSLDPKVKRHIQDIIQQEAETKRNIHYPVRTDKPYQDTGVTYESKEDIVIEDKHGLSVIPAGTKIIVL